MNIENFRPVELQLQPYRMIQGGFYNLPEELFSSIFSAIMHDRCSWNDVGRLARVCKFFFSSVTKQSQMLYFLKQRPINQLGIGKELAVKILNRYCQGATDVEVDFTDGQDFQEKYFQAIATTCSYRKFRLKESKKSMFIRDEVIATLARHSPSLKALSLNGGCALSDKSIEALSTHCRNLHSLTLWNTNLSDRGLISIGEKWGETLHSLALYYAGSFSYIGLKGLMKCSKISHFKFLSDVSPSASILTDLAAAWRDLKSLEIRSAHKITAADIGQIMQVCPQLQILIFDNLLLTADCLQAILCSANSLQEIRFDYSCFCKNLSPAQIIAQFVQHRAALPELRKIHYNSRVFSFDALQQDQLRACFPLLSITSDTF